jgi:TetR/AcrR family transcriptional regulator, transcriptional repressor for nem operon
VVGRPKNFDEGDVVAKATLAFWEHGYESTSIADLEAATGLSRVSIYNTFGDKEGLFLRVLDHYHATVSSQLAHLLADDGLVGIERFFRAMTMPRPPGSPFSHGCLMVNAVLDSRGVSDDAVARVKDYRAMFKTAFQKALGQAVRLNQVADDDQCERRAEYLVGVLWGLLVTTRLAHDTQAGAPIVDVLSITLTSWRGHETP